MTPGRSDDDRGDEGWFAVVVTDGENVLAVLGPKYSELEANAVRSTIRLSNGRKASVHRVRPPDWQDMHADWTKP